MHLTKRSVVFFIKTFSKLNESLKSSIINEESWISTKFITKSLTNDCSENISQNQFRSVKTILEHFF